MNQTETSAHTKASRRAQYAGVPVGTIALGTQFYSGGSFYIVTCNHKDGGSIRARRTGSDESKALGPQLTFGPMVIGWVHI